jgi:DNA repair protein RadD
MKALRPYQAQAIDALYRYWQRGRGMRPLLEVPTGAGKSLIIAHVARDVVEAGGTVLVLAHRRELVAQNAAELGEAWPTAPIGIYSAGLRRREVSAVTFANVQSIYRHGSRLGRIDLVVVDEAHMIPRRSDAQYGTLLAALGETYPDMRMVGLTATPYRLDSGRLDQGEGAIFDGLAYSIGVAGLVDSGFLSPVVSRAGARKISTEGVRRRGGEWVASELQSAAMADELPEAIAADIVAHGEGRRGWMVFSSGVAHAERLAELLRGHGVSVGVVTGETKDRDEILSRFRAQELRALVNCDVLTTGFNAPHVDLIALARATESTSLYVQIVGRGMRLYEGKENCLLLDYGSNVQRHGPIDDVRVVVQGGGDGDGEPPGKECPQCRGLVHAARRECDYCGHVFDVAERGGNLSAEAYAGDVIRGSTLRDPEWWQVDAVLLRRHRKEGRPDSVRVTYECGLAHVSEWVCPEHDGYPRRKYEAWCKEVGVEPASTVTEALRCRPRVSEIKVVRRGKYEEVLARRLAQVAAGDAGLDLAAHRLGSSPA